MTITKDMLVDDLIQVDPMMPMILMRQGLHCVGCASSLGETIEQAAIVHGLDPELLIDQINDFLNIDPEE